MNEDVVAKIEHDHREVEDLFAEFEQSEDRAIAMQICDELEAHTAAEEAEVYPVIAEVADEEMTEHAEEEHDEAKALIRQIRATSDADELRSLVGELKAAIAHHVAEEESEMLPMARDLLTEERLEELGEKFDEAKDEAGR
jgi:hemerythrin superfamily protein